MLENILLIQEEEWGLRLSIKEGVKVDNNNILPMFRQIIELAKSKGMNRLVISALTTQRKVSIVNMFQVGKILLDLKAVGFKIAFIAPHLAGNEESRFMENVGYNRGALIKYFSDSDEALHWIKS